MVYKIVIYVGSAQDQEQIKKYAECSGIFCEEEPYGELSLQVKTTVDLLMPVLIDIHQR